MTEQLQPFQSEALDTLAQVIGGHFTGSEITKLFRRSGFSDVVHDGGTKWRFVASTFTELQARGKGTPNGVLQVLKTAGNPQGWIGHRDQYDQFLRSINAVLAFYSLQLDDKGALLQTAEKVTTVRSGKNEDEASFEDRGFHPEIVKHGRSHFCRGAYFHAVFECCKAFDTAIRNNSGSTKSGPPLMSEALNLSGPIKFNSQQKQSEKDEQQGVMYLCMGLMNAVRNPQAHEPELNWPMAREDALDVLALVSFLYRKLEHAVVVGQDGTGTARKVTL